MRLTSVRFFATGETNTSGKLLVRLTHYGNETLYRPDNTKFKCEHAPLFVNFKYDVATGSYNLPDTYDGKIGSRSQNQFANVGPFVIWRVELTKKLNEGLDVSNIFGGYFKFNGHSSLSRRSRN